MASVVTIAGSPSAPSRSAAILDYARGLLVDRKFEVLAITIRDLPAEDLIKGRYDSPAIQAAKGLIDIAEGIIVATPVYKAAYSGVLKTFLDVLPANVFTGKWLLPIVSGGSNAHSLALD